MRDNLKSKILLNISLLGVCFFGFQIAKGQTHSDCLNAVADWEKAVVQRKKNPVYQIDSRFTVEERAFVERTVKIAVDRIQEKSIWEDVSNAYSFAYPKSVAVTKAGFCNSKEIRQNLLFHQLHYLATARENYSQDAFPKINIYYKNEPPKKGETGWVGYAFYNRVSVYWDFAAQNWKRRGDFQLYLNQHFLQQSGIYKNENYWAGTIVHEMMHNLGHQHPNAGSERYNQYQINLLANAVRNFGRTESAGDIVYPTHNCRLKSTGTETAGDIE